MQIEVVDDCSTQDDPEEVVREVGNDRVEFFRKPKNEGATANFNTCIQRSRGHLVHILHGDDLVCQGFYKEIDKIADQYREAALFAARVFIIDGGGELLSLSPRLKTLENFSCDPTPFLYSNPFYTPGVVIRRRFYEEFGGFNSALIHMADWELWIRAIYQGGGVSVNSPLASYRKFESNDTGKLMQTGENLRDQLRLGEILAERFHEFDSKKFRFQVSKQALRQSELFQRLSNSKAANANIAVWKEIADARAKLVRITQRLGLR
jgi:glycosyltransferase involved in cell wall biosynthesis